MFMKSEGLSGMRLLAVVGAVVMSGCGYSAEEAATEAEASTASVRQALYCTPCPTTMTAYRGQNDFQLVCGCSSSAASSGSLWGTGTYTDDSTLCRAAVHAGAITTSGGAVLVTVKPGQSSYTGSTSNGVTSSSYPGYSGSFTVAANGSCEVPPPACPEHFAIGTSPIGSSLTCFCSSAYIQSASHDDVWGTDTYTHDSALCHAAIHAGVITASGGVIHPVITAGELAYHGTTRNGITSRSYGEHSRSYIFQ